MAASDFSLALGHVQEEVNGPKAAVRTKRTFIAWHGGQVKPSNVDSSSVAIETRIGKCNEALNNEEESESEVTNTTILR